MTGVFLLLGCFSKQLNNSPNMVQDEADVWRVQLCCLASAVGVCLSFLKCVLQSSSSAPAFSFA